MCIRDSLNPNGSELGGRSFRFALRGKAGELLTELVVIPRDGMPLTLEESDFLEQLTLQIAIAIENARNHERIIHLQRVEQDLASARAIQHLSLIHICKYRSTRNLTVRWCDIEAHERLSLIHI